MLLLGHRAAHAADELQAFAQAHHDVEGEFLRFCPHCPNVYETGTVVKMAEGNDDLPAEWLTALAGWGGSRPEAGEVWVHGSRVTGRARAESDIDIAVKLSREADLSTIIR